MSESKVLFLDDAGWRHSSFTRISDRIPSVRVWQAHHAVGAIQLLDSVDFDQVFLDHDLSELDVMVVPGQASHVPTGMTVVDHICKMERPPRHVIVHSMNEPAAQEMVRRLQARGGIRVDRVNFADLIPLLEKSAGS